MDRTLQRRIDALAKRLCLENPVSGRQYYLTKGPENDPGWWLLGDATGDAKEAIAAVFRRLDGDMKKLAKIVKLIKFCDKEAVSRERNECGGMN